jgi:hypothetical protein
MVALSRGSPMTINTQDPQVQVRDASRPDDSSSLLPSHIRRPVYVAVGLALTFAAYLIVVRGPALIFDLAHSAYAMFCL